MSEADSKTVKKVLNGTRFAAACEAFDRFSRPNSKSEGIIFSGDELARMTNPGWWEVNGDFSQFGGFHEYRLTARIIDDPRTKMTMWVKHMVPEGLFYVDKINITSDTFEHDYKDFPSPARVRRDHYAEREIFQNAVVDWFKEKFDPLEDFEVGDESRDWEIIDQYRVSVEDPTIVSTWLRMRNRGDDTYEASFLDPGTVKVTADGLGCKVEWERRPSGIYELSVEKSFYGQKDKSGIGGWA